MTTNTNTNTNGKKITVTLAEGTREIAISGIKSVKIVNGPKAGEEGGPDNFQSKIHVLGEAEPVYARESVKELRSNDFDLVYVGDGRYAVRSNIARMEPITAEERASFAKDKKAEVDNSFVTRVVLNGELGSFWAKKSIAQLNERGVRFIGLGDGAAVHKENIRKVSELFDDDRARVAEKYNLQAADFKTQIELQGAMKPKLARRSIEEFRADGLEFIDIGAGQYVIKGNVRFFGPFDAESATLREGSDAEKYKAKITLSNGGTVLSVLPVEYLKEVMQAVNIGYDRYVPADNIVPEKVTPFTKDDKTRLADDKNYKMERAWKSSVGLANGKPTLSPATADQIRARVDKARGLPVSAPAAEGAGPEAAMG
jgi:hypothetical protein